MGFNSAFKGLKTASFPLVHYKLDSVLIVTSCNRKFKISFRVHVHGIYVLVLATVFETKRSARHTHMSSF